MPVDDALISHLGKLARLELTPESRANLGADLDKILAMVEKLSELDLEGVAPLTHLGDDGQPPRPDRVAHELSREQALENAPDHDGTFFRVPRVI
ncbi:MAG: Asp-tRNA(Asn)/Glu-tRNA(Gln) amidotransferase subunit GatC [Saprospiraceae bacterium]